MRAADILRGWELWWARWGSIRRQVPLVGTRLPHHLRVEPGSWAGYPEGLSLYRGTHLVVWGPPVTLCPFCKDGYQVFFRFLRPAPDTGPGSEQALLGLKSRGFDSGIVVQPRRSP